MWEAFFDPSDSYFLFAKERGYHKYALAYSSSCLRLKLISVPDDQGMTKRAGKIIEEFKDLVFPAGYEPGKKRVGLLSL